jgi:hypothetical protein
MKTIISMLLVMVMLVMAGTAIASDELMLRSGNWLVIKQVNDMTDEVNYGLVGFDEEGTSSITILYRPGYMFFIVNDQNMPPDAVYLAEMGKNIRVDNNPPFEVIGNYVYEIYEINEDKLISQMKNGSVIRGLIYRRALKPEHNLVGTVVVSLEGFGPAYDLHKALSGWNR